MLFFEPIFIFFLLTVKIIISLVENNKKKLVLLLSSYFFYGFWDWRFLGLIWISTVIDYTVGKLIYKTVKKIQNGPSRKIVGDESIEENWIWIDRADTEEE